MMLAGSAVAAPQYEVNDSKSSRNLSSKIDTDDGLEEKRYSTDIQVLEPDVKEIGKH